MNVIKTISLFLITALPTTLLAQGIPAGAAKGKTFSSFVYGLGGVVQTVLSLILALSVLAFLGGLAMRLLNIGSAESRTQAKYIMIYGIIGLVVSFTIIGILNISVNTLFTTL